MLLENQIVVITGGAGLLGKQLAKGILENGGTPIISDIDFKKAEFVSNELNKNRKHGTAFPYELDINSNSSVSLLVKSLIDKFGHIDSLINNAYPRNKNYGAHLPNVNYSDFCENIVLNLGGYFLVSQQFCNYFAEQGKGNIVNIGSIYGVIAPKFEIYKSTNMSMPVEYSIIKSGIIHMTKYFAKYYKNKNIKINCISPGGILNNQPKVFIENYNKLGINKGMLDASDVIGSCIFLLSELSNFVNGQNLIVDDGVCL
ncbi:MAG: SDR family oxidoreductase [Bdellovibrionaceae bacterium]|nr:SDR family oxidoreductase [Pseudobdellovibrionaceae bacterium]